LRFKLINNGWDTNLKVGASPGAVFLKAENPGAGFKVNIEATAQENGTLNGVVNFISL